MKRCVIGIAGNLNRDEKGVERYTLSDEYIQSIRKSGAEVLMLPVQEEIPESWFGLCDGFLFPGGMDIHPKFYGEEKSSQVEGEIERLDEYQIRLLKKVAERKLPFLAVCRGIQIMNVAFGGTLWQDIPNHRQTEERSELRHSVLIRPGTRLQCMLGDQCRVNSFHHQAVKNVGEHLVVSALAADGTIEAAELSGNVFGVGVQWHPEVMDGTGDSMRPLFDGFIHACRK